MISVGSEVQILPGPPISLVESLVDWRGCSSAGRAPALQAGGHRFEPVHLHSLGASIPLGWMLGRSRRREDCVFGFCRGHLRSEGFLRWPMVSGASLVEAILASVLWNCESGSGASLGAPLVGGPCERAPTSHRAQVRPMGIAKSDRSRPGRGQPRLGTT